MFFNNAIADAEPQAGACPNRLGREKGIENAVEVFLGDADAIIPNHEPDPFIAGGFGVNPDLTAIRDSLHRILQQFINT